MTQIDVLIQSLDEIDETTLTKQQLIQHCKRLKIIIKKLNKCLG